MEPETLQFLASLGVGGVLAGGMFLAYRKDQQACEDRWRGQSEMFAQIVKENSTAITKLCDRLDER